MLHTAITASFRPPLEQGASPALWLSIFPAGYVGRVVVRDWVYDGPDAADRALGTLAAAVVVADTGGFPDAFDVAQAAIVAGRPVFFFTVATAARRWPTSLAYPSVTLGSSVPQVLRALAPLLVGRRPDLDPSPGAAAPAGT